MVNKAFAEINEKIVLEMMSIITLKVTTNSYSKLGKLPILVDLAEMYIYATYSNDILRFAARCR